MKNLGGASKIMITPPVGFRLAGYGDRTQGSVGVHDDLYAKALVLDDGFWIGERSPSPTSVHTFNLMVPALKNREIHQNLASPNQRIVMHSPVYLYQPF